MHTPTPGPAKTDPIQHAVGVLAPLWTSWTLETFRERGPMRVRELTAAMAWLNVPQARQVAVRMHSSSLLNKSERGGYVPSRLGQHAYPAHRALASWHARHFERNSAAWRRGDRVEDAFARLRGKGTIEVLSALEQRGPLRPGALREAAGLASGSFHYRSQQLLHDGLVTRRGPEQHFAYALTPAARQLAPVYAELDEFGRRRQFTAIAGETNQHSWVASRSRAARQQSPAAPTVTGLFSHPNQPPPRVPATITALSRPPRAR